ncbi:MAG: hypothetical protein KDK71_05405 [Chlamydiia bacterium]|nr:hypothetical protein [Chlamydiia bacterium]
MGTIFSALSDKTWSACQTIRVGINKTVSVASFFKEKVSDASWGEFGKFRSYLWKNKNVSYLKGVFSPYAHYLPWNKQGEEGEAREKKPI